MQPNDSLKQMVTNAFPFVARTGLELVELERGYVKMRMPIRENQNHVGTMYAGALFTLAEAPGGAMWLASFDTKRCYPIVRNVAIDFRRPANTDVTVVARLDEAAIQAVTKTAEESGKANFELKTEMFDEQGTLVANAMGTYQLRRLGT